MLIGMISCLSVAAAVLVCVGTGAFESLGWLWILPLSALGSFLVLLLAAVGFFVVLCSFIDPNKPREQDTPWFRKMVLRYLAAIFTILPIRIKTHGLEKIPQDGRFLLVCNHLHEIDPAFLLHCFPKSQLAFVGKKETADMFLVNKVMPKLLCQMIDRENDREALKTILRCIGLLKADTVSIAIFPEGRINKFRKLAHFRPGVFKIAQKAQVPVVVCTLQNTNHVIKRLLQLKGTTVEVHLLDVIPAERLEGRTTVDIAEEVYAMMAEDLGPEKVLTPEEEEKA